MRRTFVAVILTLACLGCEIGSMLPVLSEFATEDHALPSGAKHVTEYSHVKLVGRLDQRICSLLRRIKGCGVRRRRNRFRRSFLRWGLLRSR